MAEPLPAGESFPLPVTAGLGSEERPPTVTGFPLSRAEREAEETGFSEEELAPAVSRVAEASRDTAPGSSDRGELARSPLAPERWPVEDGRVFFWPEDWDFFFLGFLALEEEGEALEDEDDEDDDDG